MAGMKRAMMHAIDMNHNGRIDDKELEEFRRFIVGEAMTSMPMHLYAQAPKGDIEQLQRAAGYDDDDERHPREIEKSRKGIAGKIVADYLGQLWNEGHVDDKTYIQEMQRIGAADIRDQDDADPKDIASKVWAAANGAAPDEVPADEQSDEVDPEFLNEFYKRNPKKGS